MPNRHSIYHLTKEQDAKQASDSRKVVKRSGEILKETPDTFLGRKTYEPFPKEEEEILEPPLKK